MSATSGRGPAFRVSVPAPVTLFGDHQDLLDQPTIYLATNFRVKLAAVPRPDRDLVLFGAHGEKLSLALDGSEAPTAEAALLRAVQTVAAESGRRLTSGYDLLLEGNVPPALEHGLAAAMSVAWTVFALHATGRLEAASGGEIARLAWRALQLAEPKRALVGFAAGAGFGGMVMAGTTPNAPVATYDKPGATFVLGLAPATHSHRQEVSERCAQALLALRRYFPHFSAAASTLEEIVPLLADIAEDQAQIIYAMMAGRDLCRSANEALAAEGITDADVIGELLDLQHEMLRDHLKVVHEQQEVLIEAAREAGALGAKADTVDGGGILAFAPENAGVVAAALEKAGAAAHIVVPAPGMSFELPEE